MSAHERRAVAYAPLDLERKRATISSWARLSIYQRSRLENSRCFAAGKKFLVRKPFVGQLTSFYVAHPRTICAHSLAHPGRAGISHAMSLRFAVNGAAENRPGEAPGVESAA